MRCQSCRALSHKQHAPLRHAHVAASIPSPSSIHHLPSISVPHTNTRTDRRTDGRKHSCVRTRTLTHADTQNRIRASSRCVSDERPKCACSLFRICICISSSSRFAATDSFRPQISFSARNRLTAQTDASKSQPDLSLSLILSLSLSHSLSLSDLMVEHTLENAVERRAEHTNSASLSTAAYTVDEATHETRPIISASHQRLIPVMRQRTRHRQSRCHALTSSTPAASFL